MSSEQRRTKYDIYADVIEVVSRKGSCSLTRISYGANMPVDRAKKVVDLLVSHGFIREVNVGERNKFRATRWGLEYLQTYKRMRRFFAALDEPVTVKMPEVILPGRVTTGYKDLDNLLFGGIPENYAVILTSPSCDERDLLVKRFLKAGVRKRQITLCLTTETSDAEALAEDPQSPLHLFICNPQADTIVRSSPNVTKLKGVENLNDINIALNSVLRELSEEPSRPRRACIQIVSDILLQHHAVQTRRWLTRIIPELKVRRFITLAVMNPQMHSSEETHAILGLFDGEINLFEKESENDLKKFLKIRKMHNQRYQEVKLPLRKERLEI